MYVNYACAAVATCSAFFRDKQSFPLAPIANSVRDQSAVCCWPALHSLVLVLLLLDYN